MNASEPYRETYRPQFHFSAKKDRMSDPNGLVYYKGEYHLFFQHNSISNMRDNAPKELWPDSWGHAVSTDLVHWKQLEHALVPDDYGWIWSGSAVVDWNNTTGLKQGDEETIVAIYTHGGFGLPPNPCVQAIHYSNDRGRTWTRYENNPILGYIVGENRDPKVIWHKPTQKWVMSLYLDGNEFALFSSPNLKEWTRLCDIHIPDTSECPDFFELPVNGSAENTKWVAWGANGNHYIGAFDGHNFHAESGVLRAEFGNNFYAAQTWSDIPESDGRRIQIAWMNGGEYPDMLFSQQMSFPCELTLRTTPEGVRLCRQPVREIETLRQQEYLWKDEALKPGENLLSDISGDLFDIRAEIELGDATEVGFTVRAEKIQYSVAKRQLSCLGRSVCLAPIDNRIQLQILVDRTSIEVFGNAGRVSMSSCFVRDPEQEGLGLYAAGGAASVVSMKVYELCSVWRQPDA